MTKQYYRPDEVATILGYSIKTVYRWIRREVVPSSKILGTYRISKAELNKLLRDGPREPAEK